MWKQALVRWSQTAYGLIHSINIGSKIDLGNINRIGKSITESFNWLPREDQFSSKVGHRPYKEDDFRLDDEDVHDIITYLKENLLFLLLVNLATLTDELLSSIMVKYGVNVEKYPYLRKKAEAVVCGPKQEWARFGVLELNIIRNCLVHNEGKWSDRALKDITSIVEGKPIATVGNPVTINYEDVFRYKRAVRTLLNQAEKYGFSP
jgi:hypothetical protein